MHFFDLHCDTALAMLNREMVQEKGLRKNECHIDLERASKLSGYAQCFACFTTPFMEKWAKVSPIVVFERELVTIQRELEDPISEAIIDSFENPISSIHILVEEDAVKLDIH